jgi:hypothetical protein
VLDPDPYAAWIGCQLAPAGVAVDVVVHMEALFAVLAEKLTKEERIKP